MDTKTLVVGHKVWMRSGDQFKEATVKEITKHYIDVEPIRVDDVWGRYFLRFHISRLNWLNGKQAGMFRYLGEDDWVEYDRRPLCTEFGPWELDGVISVEARNGPSRSANRRRNHVSS